MIRAVLDTNVIVSALLQPDGLPARILLMAVSGTAVQLCVSGAIYAEYEEVIRRPHFKRGDSEISTALAAIREKGFWVRPVARVLACTDPDDNIFLECAEAAQADYLVTGNLKHFPSVWHETRIVSPRQFLEAIAEIED